MTNLDPLPRVIQGGMGVGVSNWPLARAVSGAGQLGVVSGTAIDVVLARRLQLGDIGGHMRRALEALPLPGVAERILRRYFIPGGKPAAQPFRTKPLLTEKPRRDLIELLVAANFVEVFLAREGHDGPVGINFLEKVQLPTLPSLYGAMLAGVSCVLMGAGIPRAIPGVLDRLAARQPVELSIDVQGADRGRPTTTTFAPEAFFAGPLPALTRPDFLAIISSATLASMMARKANGRVDGFIIEGASAGGHNAPPRGPMRLSVEGEPVYGERDRPDLEAIAALGLPFWLAGSCADPTCVADALRVGAAGVQVGTAFAFCAESGLDASLKARVLALSQAGKAEVFTDPVASPTGFPFKVLQVAGSLSDRSAYEERERVCDIGYLRHAYQKPDGTLGWRCPGEPKESYIRKGGDEASTRGRKCVCNGLFTNIGLGQVRQHAEPEKMLVTSGDDVAGLAKFLKLGMNTYTARDVIDYLVPACATLRRPTTLHLQN